MESKGLPPLPPAKPPKPPPKSGKPPALPAKSAKPPALPDKSAKPLTLSIKPSKPKEKSGLLLAYEKMATVNNGKVTLDQLRKAIEDNGCEWDVLEDAVFKVIDINDTGSIALNGTFPISILIKDIKQIPFRLA